VEPGDRALTYIPRYILRGPTPQFARQVPAVGLAQAVVVAPARRQATAVAVRKEVHSLVVLVAVALVAARRLVTCPRHGAADPWPRSMCGPGGRLVPSKPSSGLKDLHRSNAKSARRRSSRSRVAGTTATQIARRRQRELPWPDGRTGGNVS